MKTSVLKLTALLLVLAPIGVQATPMTYGITLTPSTGPSGSGSFQWDNGTDVVSNFFINLGPFGPFPGGTNDGAPLTLGTGIFNGTAFTSDIDVTWSPYFDVMLRTGGTYDEFNGRMDGTYAITPTRVPEPAGLALFALGLAGIGFARRRKA